MLHDQALESAKKMLVAAKSACDATVRAYDGSAEARLMVKAREDVHKQALARFHETHVQMLLPEVMLLERERSALQRSRMALGDRLDPEVTKKLDTLIARLKERHDELDGVLVKQIDLAFPIWPTPTPSGGVQANM